MDLMRYPSSTSSSYNKLTHSKDKDKDQDHKDGKDKHGCAIKSKVQHMRSYVESEVEDKDSEAECSVNEDTLW